MRLMRYHFDMTYGQWMVRGFGRLFALKAPWLQPLFSERYRLGVRVLPLGFGWRVTIRKISPLPPGK